MEQAGRCAFRIAHPSCFQMLGKQLILRENDWQ